MCGWSRAALPPPPRIPHAAGTSSAIRSQCLTKERTRGDRSNSPHSHGQSNYEYSVPALYIQSPTHSLITSNPISTASGTTHPRIQSPSSSSVLPGEDIRHVFGSSARRVRARRQGLLRARVPGPGGRGASMAAAAGRHGGGVGAAAVRGAHGAHQHGLLRHPARLRHVLRPPRRRPPRRRHARQLMGHRHRLRLRRTSLTLSTLPAYYFLPDR